MRKLEKISILVTCLIILLCVSQANAQMSSHYLKEDVEIISAIQNNSDEVVINFKINEKLSDWEFGGVQVSYLEGGPQCIIVFIRSPKHGDLITEGKVETKNNKDGSYSIVIPLKNRDQIYMLSGNDAIRIFSSKNSDKKTK